MTFRIQTATFQLGEKLKSAQEICNSLGLEYQRLIEKTGFENLHVTEKNDIEFYQGFLTEHLILSDDDVVILVNQTFMGSIPGAAPIIFEKIPNAQKVCFIEISDGCSGFLRALIIADSLLTTSGKRIHIVCAEKYSNFISNENRTSRPIFSDAISLVTLETGTEYEIIDSRVINNFQDFKSIIISGSENQEFEMQGAKVLKWTSVAVSNQIKELLDANSIEIRDISGLYLHQGSRIVVETISNSIGYLKDSPFMSSQIGNTVSSSIPALLSLNSANSNDFMKNGINVFSAFGIGLSSISILIKKNPE